MPLGRRWKLAIMLLLVAASLCMSGYAAYHAYRPKVVERVVENTRLVPQDCPKVNLGKHEYKPKSESGSGTPKSPPSQASTGNNNAQVGSLTQGSESAAQVGGSNNTIQSGGQRISAPNGIAIGGNATVDKPTVNNYFQGQPPATGSWRQSGAAYVEGKGYVNTVTFSVEKRMASPEFVFTCDSPCTFSNPNVTGLGFNQVTGKTINDHTLAVEFGSLEGNSTVTVRLSSEKESAVTEASINQ